VLVALELDLGARVLAEEDAVANLDFEGANGAVLQDLAIANREDFALERLLFGRVGDDDAPLGLLFFFHALYDDAVRQGPELHGYFLLTTLVLGVTTTKLLALHRDECQPAAAR
jgi:hypothetical protein